MEHEHWDMDSRSYELTLRDPISEVIPVDMFNKKINDMLSIRSEVVERSKVVEGLASGTATLRLRKIIGRRAVDRRMNLHYDVFHRWVYSSGCNIVLSKDNSQFYDPEEFVQEFFLADDTTESCSPEVSCLSLSRDRRFLIAGTCEEVSTLLIWNICSRIRLKHIRLPRINEILMAKLSHDNTHICAYGITENYSGVVFLIEVESERILGICNFLQSTPWRIKDIEFLHEAQHEFITVGVKHMTLWMYKGNSLTYRQLPQD
jgi:hypothetical protein